MGQVSAQLAAHIPHERIHLSTSISTITPGRITTAAGHTITANHIIVATEGPVASTLLGLPLVKSRSVACVYFAAETPPTKKKLIILDGTGQGPVLNIAVMSNIAPAYAPEGQHLIAAAIPGCNDDQLRDADLESVARHQLTTMFGAIVNDWRHLRTYRINHGQPDQSPPFQPKDPVSLGDGLFVCGDHRDTASIQGALYSGRRCAEAVLTGS
jgi:protoporphyrinogen oxidase